MAKRIVFEFQSEVYKLGGKCPCGFEFLTNGKSPRGQYTFDDFNERAYRKEEENGDITFYCPECKNWLGAIIEMEMDTGFENEMLKPFSDAGVAIPMERMEEMKTIYNAKKK